MHIAAIAATVGLLAAAIAAQAQVARGCAACYDRHLHLALRVMELARLGHMAFRRRGACRGICAVAQELESYGIGELGVSWPPRAERSWESAVSLNPG
jgi:hypothetical protein